jgi:hypothetical protein
MPYTAVHVGADHVEVRAGGQNRTKIPDRFTDGC